MANSILITYVHKPFFSSNVKAIGGEINGKQFNRSDSNLAFNEHLSGGEKSAITQLFNRVRAGKRQVCHIWSLRNRMPICQLGLLMEAFGVTCGHESLISAMKDLKRCGPTYAVKVGKCRKL
jgi:hypothetical protein